MNEDPVRRLIATGLKIAGIAPAVLEHEYTAACCIPAATIAVDLFECCGYGGRVVPVTLQCLSPEFLRLTQTLGRFPSADEAKEAKAAHVIIGAGTPPEGAWEGHLVAVIQERLLVDFATSQASDKQAGFVAPSFLMVLLEEQWFQQKGLAACHDLGNGWEAQYFHRQDLDGTWKRPEKAHQQQVVTEILRLLTAPAVT